MKYSRFLSILIILGTIGFCGILYAQSDLDSTRRIPHTSTIPSLGNQPDSNPTNRTMQTIRDLLPLYLIEKNGELVPALNWTPEELDALAEQAQQNQRQNQIPDYICERLTLTGIQKGDVAEMELTLLFTVPEKPVVRIPLQLNSIVLLEPPQCSPNEFLAPQNDGGYVLYLKNVQQKTDENTQITENKQTNEENKTEENKAETKQEETKAETSPIEEKHETAEKSEKSPSEIVSDSMTVSTPNESHSHQITLKVLIPLKKTHTIYSMNLKLPKALYSSISLDVPFSSSELRFSTNAATSIPPESINDNKETRLKVYSLGSDFQIQWQKQNTSPSDKQIKEVLTDIYVDINHGELLYSVSMQMQFSDVIPNAINIILPQSAELIPVTTPQYSVQRPENATESNIATVSFSDNSLSSAKIAFKARVSLNKLDMNQWFNLMGFEVQNATKQSGWLGITVDKEKQILWNPGQYVRRVDNLPETFEGSYQYAFQFSEQPGKLLIRQVSGQTRMNVLPRFIATINADEIKLEATWKYNIRGNQTSWLDIDLQGWQLRSTKDIGSENIITDNTQEENGRVSIHLSQSVPDSMELTMTLYRKINLEDKTLSFTLPRPVPKSADESVIIDSGLLYVISATNIKLTPQIENPDAMVQQIFTISEQQHSNTNETFCYRLDSLDAIFKTEFSINKRQIDIWQAQQITIADSSLTVEQKFDFSVQYEPLSQAVFYGSESLAECSNLEVKLNGKPLAIRTTQTKEQTRITALMDQPRIGKFNITLSYHIPFDIAITKNQFVTPFAQFEKQGLTNINITPTILLGLERTWELLPLSSPWKLEEINDIENIIDIQPNTNQPSVLSDSEIQDDSLEKLEQDNTVPLLNYMVVGLESKTPKRIPNDNKEPQNEDHLADIPSTFSFAIVQRQGMVWNTLTIDRAWIQTMLTVTRRQDTACFRFTSPHSQITLCLPSQTDMGSLEILLDDKSMEQFRIDSGQKVVLTVPTDKNLHTLEISYYFTRTKQGFDKENIALPYIKEAQWTRWFYWSISIPQNIHLFVPPKQLNAEYTWQRQGPFFRRVAVHSFESLEQWSGARHLPDPPQGVNVYLFSGFGPTHEVELILMNRTLLAFIASLIVLVPGLIFIHFKHLRHTWLLTLVAIVLLTASLWEPELALIFLQSSALGLALLALSFLFRKKTPVMSSNNDSTVFQPNGNSTQTR